MPMRKLALSAVLATLVAGPALATELTIEVAGEGANGTIVIDMADDVAPNHVAQIAKLAKAGAYDGVVFHRVIDGFMAQTGDVQNGKQGGDTAQAGMGGSDKPDLEAEFTETEFDRGTVGMARAMDPNSANSQFFIDLAPAPFLNGEYTVVGQLIEGWDVLDAIKKGDSAANGAVSEPDYMMTVTIAEEEGEDA